MQAKQGPGRLGVLVAAALAAVACSQHSSNLRGSDRAVGVPALRFVVESDRRHDGLVGRPLLAPSPTLDELAYPDGTDPRAKPERWLATTGWAYELEGFIGTMHDKVGAGEVVDFGDQGFTGPKNVSLEVDLTKATAVWRKGVWWNEWLGLEGRVGVGAALASYEARGSGFSENGYGLDAGPTAGARLAIRPKSWLTLYGRADWLGGFRGNHGINMDVRTAELGAEFLLTRHCELFGGWRWTQLEDESLTHSDHGQNSDVLVRAIGFVAGLQFQF